MQNEQRLLQPSCTFRLGRVFSAMAVAGEDRSGDQLSVGKDVADQRECRGGECDSFQTNKIVLAVPDCQLLLADQQFPPPDACENCPLPR